MAKESLWETLFYKLWMRRKDNIRHTQEGHDLAKYYFHKGYQKGKGD